MEIINSLVENRRKLATFAMLRSWQNSEITEARKKHMSEAKTGKVNVCVGTKWIQKGDQLKRVPADKVDTYLADGWFFSSSKGVSR